MAGYFLDVPADKIRFECCRLRRERHELVGELIVRCGLPEARTVKGILTTADFNFSSLRARQDRARHLTQRSNTNGSVDWYGLLEEFCQIVFDAERQGAPSMDVWELPLPETADDFAIDGLAFPRSLPSILFGDGGSLKSYLALYLAGRLAIQGISVAYFDWELSGREHRERFDKLFGSHQPRPTMRYCHCEQPLSYEIERLHRVVHDHHIQYAFFDSISFAVDGRAEDHETCLHYFGAARQLGVGGLHLAHTNRSENADQKPFGSSFWHNGARSTWFAKAEPSSPSTIELGLHHRKANTGPLRPSVAFKVHFTSNRTTFTRASIQDTPAIAPDVRVWQRIEALLLIRGPLPISTIAFALDLKPDTVRKTVHRKVALFHILDGDIVALVQLAARS